MTYHPLSPFRSAPFIAPEAPARPFPLWRVVASAIGLIALNYRHEIGAAIDRHDQQQSQAAVRAGSRAEQNARRWARSAYGVDPWVRCFASRGDITTCNAVVAAGAPFSLRCQTATDGDCWLGGAR